MRPEDRVRFQHMLDAAMAAMDFVEGRDRSAFDDDRMLLFAVVRAVEVLGEAASRVTVETVRCGLPQRSQSSVRA